MSRFKTILVCIAVANIIGATLNMFGTLFNVAGLIIAGAAICFTACLAAFGCLIYVLK
jgi:hypothetical protein